MIQHTQLMVIVELYHSFLYYKHSLLDKTYFRVLSGKLDCITNAENSTELVSLYTLDVGI